MSYFTFVAHSSAMFEALNLLCIIKKYPKSNKLVLKETE